MAKRRESGFYWVRPQGGGWLVAEWCSRDEAWSLHGNEEYYTDRDFVQINENALTPRGI